MLIQGFGPADDLVIIRGGRSDLLKPVLRYIHELRNVHGAVGGGGVLDQDGRAVVALRVDMRQDTICVYSERPLEEKTSQRPLGEKLCQEFIGDMLHPSAAPCRLRRAR